MGRVAGVEFLDPRAAPAGLERRLVQACVFLGLRTAARQCVFSIEATSTLTRQRPQPVNGVRIPSGALRKTKGFKTCRRQNNKSTRSRLQMCSRPCLMGYSLLGQYLLHSKSNFMVWGMPQTPIRDACLRAGFAAKVARY